MLIWTNKQETDQVDHVQRKFIDQIPFKRETN